MIKVQRGNVILNVKPEDKRYYLDKGYDIIDSDGTIIEKAIPRDIGSLRKLYLETNSSISNKSSCFISIHLKRLSQSFADKFIFSFRKYFIQFILVINLSFVEIL